MGGRKQPIVYAIPANGIVDIHPADLEREIHILPRDGQLFLGVRVGDRWLSAEELLGVSTDASTRLGLVRIRPDAAN